MRIGNIELNNNVMLAPMAGISDYSFRTICRSFGIGLAFTEMVSSKALYYKDERTKKLLRSSLEDSPLAVQLFGSEPAIMAYAASQVEDWGYKIIDINMGCPTPKIVNNGDGCSLMKSPRLIGEIVQAVSNAVKIPVMVKMRAGWDLDSINAIVCAKIAEQSGAAAVTIHGRTKDMFYSGKADRGIIKSVKDTLSIPVIANGDIADEKSARDMLFDTGADGIMIGRAALGNPWIFDRIVKCLLTSDMPLHVTNEGKLQTALHHCAMLIQEKGEYIGVRESRKHMTWYMKGIKNANKYKELVNKVETYKEMENVLANIDYAK